MYIKLNATNPAPPAGAQNAHFRTDATHLGTSADPEPVSAYIAPFTGDSGAGGVSGIVPAPAAGDAAAGKVLGAAGAFVLPPVATTAEAGRVKPDGATIDVSSDGTISVPTSTASALGLVKPDGTTVTITSDGVLSASGSGSGSSHNISFGSADPNGANTPAEVQSASGSSSSTYSASFSNSVTKENLLLLVFHARDSSTETLSVSDTVGTTYALFGSTIGIGSKKTYFYGGYAAASGANSIKVTGSSVEAVLLVYEFSQATLTLDGAIVLATGSATTETLSVTTSYSNDLLLSSYLNGFGYGQSLTASSPWVAATGATSNLQGGAAYEVAGAAGAYTVTWTYPTAMGCTVCLLALRASSNPVAGSDGDLYIQITGSTYQGWVYHDGGWHELS